MTASLFCYAAMSMGLGRGNGAGFPAQGAHSAGLAVDTRQDTRPLPFLMRRVGNPYMGVCRPPQSSISGSVMPSCCSTTARRASVTGMRSSSPRLGFFHTMRLRVRASAGA